jgi:DNA-binding CsgD family transcriptional regulator
MDRIDMTSEEHHQQESIVNADRLSPRQRDIQHLVLAGRTSREIGTALGISRRTVDHHRTIIRAKLGAGVQSARRSCSPDEPQYRYLYQTWIVPANDLERQANMAGGIGLRVASVVPIDNRHCAVLVEETIQ